MAAVGTLTDVWGHRAVRLSWGQQYRQGQREIVLGPGYLHARDAARLITEGLPGRQRDDVTGWLLAQWREHATLQARRQETDEELRQARARVHRAQRRAH